MGTRVPLMFLIAVSFCSSGCFDAKEEEVVLWLRKAPLQYDTFGKYFVEQKRKERGWRPVQPYESWDKWMLEGRKIAGCEEVLLGFCKEKEGESGFSRQFIVEALGCVGSQKSVPTLLAILDDENEESPTRSSAAFALGQIGSPIAVPALHKIIDRPWPPPTPEANFPPKKGEWAVGKPPPDPYSPAELAVIHERDVKHSAIRALVVIDPDEARRVIQRELQSGRVTAEEDVEFLRRTLQELE